MSNLLSANMARLKGNKAFWCGFLLLTVLGAVERIGIYADTDSSQLDEAFWIGALLIGFVLSVFVSLFVGTEYSDGAMRNKVISGHTRLEIYLANVTACIFAGWLMCLGCVAASLIVGIPLLGFFQEPAQTVLLYGICVFALTAAYAAIFCLITMLNPNRSVSAIICVSLAFILLFAGTAISNQLEEEESYFIPDESLAQGEIADPETSQWVSNPSYLNGTDRRAYELMFEILPGGQSLQLSGMLDESRHYGEMFLASLAWTVLSCGCGLMFFQKRDLK